MSNFPIPDNPEFKSELRKLETTDPVHADTFNKDLEVLIENDVALSKLSESSKDDIAELHTELATTSEEMTEKINAVQTAINKQLMPIAYYLLTHGINTDIIKVDNKNLSRARKGLAATTVGNYALFGGGYDDSVYATLNAFDTSLTESSVMTISGSRYDLAATTVGNYALFGGGINSESGGATDVSAHDTSLTKTIATKLSQGRGCLAATTVGNYALFGGGYETKKSSYGTSGASYATVDAYDASLTRTIATELSMARYSLAATTVGNYALFGGGHNYSDGTDTVTVDAYDASLTRTIPTGLIYSSRLLAATTVGNYALFGGGYDVSNVVNAYDTSLTKTIATELSQGRDKLAATTLGGYAIFGGGGASGRTSNYDVVDTYNTSLIKATIAELSIARYSLAATTVGNYALFGGGCSYVSNSSEPNYSRVDVYSLYIAS